jgi:competence protein ComEC
MIQRPSLDCQNKRNAWPRKSMLRNESDSDLTPRRQPFLYIASAFIFGILADNFAPPAFPLLATVLITSALASTVLFLLDKERAVTVSLIVAIFLAGAALSCVERRQTRERRDNRLIEDLQAGTDGAIDLTGILALPPEPAPDARYLDVEILSLRAGNETFSHEGRVRLMVHLRDAQSEHEFDRLGLKYGSRARILVRLERAGSYLNPGSPDFDQYLERAGYDFRGTIKSPLLIENIGPRSANVFLDLLYRARLATMSAIDSRFTEPTAGTLKAMLMGNRYFLDAETSERLRESSTFHALSISGMHVGILAWFLVGGWKKGRRGAARVLISVGVLWAYAVMVGLAPPVMRATTMITVGLMGPLFFRRGATINTVALAAFLMLALKPALIADPGFQLSFVAVAAIVLIAMPLIERLRRIGEWRPAPEAPHPPLCPRGIRFVSECLFWNERDFREEMRRSPIRYRMDKSRLAKRVSLWRAQPVFKSVALLIITSAAIQLATLPLMAFYFNRVAPIGVMLNVGAGVLTALLMFSGAATLAAGLLSEQLAGLFEQLGNIAHYLLVNEITPFAWIPGASFRVAHHEGAQAIWYALFYLPLAMIIVNIDRWRPVEQIREAIGGSVGKQEPESESADERRRPLTHSATSTRFRARRAGALAGLVSIAAMVGASIAVARPFAPKPEGRLKVHFLDVGQGDCAVVIFPGGSTMLVDAGGDFYFGGESEQVEDTDGVESDFRDAAFSVGEMVVSRFLWSQGRTRLDYALATHAHVDHIGGLEAVARNFFVGELIVARAPAENRRLLSLAENCSRRDIRLAAIGSGDSFEIEGVQVQVLWPPGSGNIEGPSGNNESIVLRLDYGSVSFLLAGDIERDAEEALLRSRAALKADLLKVPHHGSNSSSTDAFVDGVAPRYAIISVGERSRFGHPHAEVLERFRGRGIRLWQTGFDGMVTAETDGQSMRVSSFKE